MSSYTSQCERLRSGIELPSSVFMGPFGERKIIFADWVASARCYRPLEEYIQDKVLPLYANTHTLCSHTGEQSNAMKKEARGIVMKAINSHPEDDVVLFTGSGATGAVNKLVSMMELEMRCAALLGEGKEPPVVFTGPYEHHSNILPWREAGCEVVSIAETVTGEISLSDLKSKLALYNRRPLKIGTFSAASNLTGVLTTPELMNKISSLLHKFRAFSFWDFAAAGPYVKIDMNPSGKDVPKDAYKDAVFISPHKFLGGAGTPGVLCVKRKVFGSKTTPSSPNVGGGTVYSVSEYSHRFLDDVIEREEGGTPNILGTIKAGLVFSLKESQSVDLIEEREEEIWKMIREKLFDVKNIHILGRNENMKKITVLSFLISDMDYEKFFHFNFISSLLNDLFGIQSRGGCMCAGPYALRLLGLSPQEMFDIEQEMLRHNQEADIIKPGFTRLNLPYFYSNEEIEYILDCIVFLAKNAKKFLPFYECSVKTGDWKFRKEMRLENIEGDIVTLQAASLGTDDEYRGEVDKRDDSRFDLQKHAKYWMETLKSVEDMVLEKNFELKSKEAIELADKDKLSSDKKFKFVKKKFVWCLLPHEVELSDDICSYKQILHPERYLPNLKLSESKGSNDAKDISKMIKRLMDEEKKNIGSRNGNLKLRTQNIIRSSIEMKFDNKVITNGVKMLGRFGRRNSILGKLLS